jgi:hypothetical protein
MREEDLMPPGIGYSFQPGVDTVNMEQGGRPGGQAASPQQAVKILNVRLPKSPLGGSSIAPRQLLESAGAAGMPGAALNQLLTALARLMQPPQAQQAEGESFDPSEQQNGMLFPAPHRDPYVPPTVIKTSKPPRVIPSIDPVPVDTRPLTPLVPPQAQSQMAYDPMPTQFDTLDPLF